MENNTHIVFGYIVEALDKNLDYYAEWERFQKHSDFGSDHDENIDNFLNVLVEEGKVAPVTPEFAYSIDQDSLPTYFAWDDIPTAEDMFDLRAAVGEEVWNSMDWRTREVYATGYRQYNFKDILTREQFFKWVADPKPGTHEEKRMMIFRGWMELRKRKAIEKQGFSIQNVFSNDPLDDWKIYSYTLGLQEKLGYELIMVNGGSGIGNVLAEAARRSLDDGLTDGTFEFIASLVNVGGEKVNLRGEVKEIPIDSSTAKHIFENINHVTKVKQVFLADKNNILPGEKGFDESFIQEIKA